MLENQRESTEACLKKTVNQHISPICFPRHGPALRSPRLESSHLPMKNPGHNTPHFKIIS